MSRFYFGGSDTSGSDDENPLPYPEPLARSAFLTSNFSPTDFLASLHNRHQTLEDLRAELRTRSQELNKELLNLVNDNYQDFLGLGGSLRGGEEKVEEVRVGLLGFRREVDTLKDKVRQRRNAVDGLLGERRAITKEIRIGRALLEVDSRLEELEERLMVGNDTTRNLIEDEKEDVDISDTDEDTDDESGAGSSIPLSRLRRRAQQYIYIKRLIAKTGAGHPFLIKQEERLLRIRQTLQLDLSTALQQATARSGDADGRGRILKLLAIYRDMGESGDAVAVLRGT